MVFVKGKNTLPGEGDYLALLIQIKTIQSTVVLKSVEVYSVHFENFR